MSNGPTRTKRIAPFIIITIAIGGFFVLVKTKPKAVQNARAEVTGTLVRTQALQIQDHPIWIMANGSAIAANEVQLKAEVGGRIVWINPNLRPGGKFKRGDILFKIDSRDYQLTVEQQQSNVSKAKLELQMERGRKAVAEKEWTLLQKHKGTSGKNALALREPHLATSVVSVQAAQSGLRKAQLNLERTLVFAPFNGFVQQESVDVGQLVSPQQALGKLVGTDEFWVQVSIPARQIPWLRLPTDAANSGSKATIWQELGPQRVEREGQLIQLYDDIDSVGQMARVLVSIQDPMGLQQATHPEQSTSQSPLPILLGSYVNLKIEAKSAKNTIEIPRISLREGNQIHVRNSEDRLEIRRVHVEWKTRDRAYIRTTIHPGDRLVITTIPVPIHGMLLREDKAKSDSGKKKDDTLAQGQEK